MVKRHAFLGMLLAAALLALLPTHAWAAGVGASPSELRFDEQLEDRTQILHVVNTGDEESSYRVYAEGEYESWFDISPSEFSLAPGKNREVVITVSPPAAASGEYTANICIVSLEPSAALQIGVGVKVPAHISAALTAQPSTPTPSASPTTPAPSPPRVRMWLAPAIVLPLLLLGIALFWHRRKGTNGAH